MDGLTILSYGRQIHLFMQLNNEKVYISLDLQSPILNAKMPNNVSWHTLNKHSRGGGLEQVYSAHTIAFFPRSWWSQGDSPLWRFLSTYNQQIPWNERLDIDDIFKFINDGNDINILTENHNFIGWAWQNKRLAGSIELEKHQIYQSKWLIDKRFLFKKSNKGLSLWWIQELKKYYRKEGFAQGVAYIDDWNKGVLKSVLRAGYEIKNWNK